MVSMPAPMCMWCKHYDRDAKGPSCKAFERIPDEIIYEQTVLHIKPYKSDNGVQFELMSEAEQMKQFGKVVPLMPRHQKALEEASDDVL